MNSITTNVLQIPEYETELPMPDCNVYVLGNKKEFYLIDSGNGYTAQKKIEVLNKAGYDLKHCRAVILTHSHYDHINGAAEFARPVYAHVKDAKEIELQSTAGVYATEGLFAMVQRAGLKLNAITISKELVEDDILEIAGDKWRVLHTPGHTPGGLCLYRKDGTIVTGDTLFSNSIGRTDFMNSNSADMKKTLQRLAAMKLSTVLPGHGEVLKNAAGTVDKIVNYFSDYL